MMPSEVKRLKQLEEENRRLKAMVADLALDKQMLQEVLGIADRIEQLHTGLHSAMQMGQQTNDIDCDLLQRSAPGPRPVARGSAPRRRPPRRPPAAPAPGRR